MPIDGVVFFLPADWKAEQKTLPNSGFRVLHTYYGHLGLFELKTDNLAQINQHLGKLLAIPIGARQGFSAIGRKNAGNARACRSMTGVWGSSINPQSPVRFRRNRTGAC